MKTEKSKKQKVSVVLPAYNEEATIEGTLKSIFNQDFPNEYEVVVCDNNSTDKTAEIAEKLGARVVLEKRKGTRFAYDKGMKESTGELILVTNADVTVPNNWISSIVDKYDAPEVVGVGTRVRYKNAPGYINSFLKLTEFFNYHRAMWGPSLSCRRWAFEKVGGFNHDVNTNEDGIFTLLIEKLGKVVYDDNVTVLMDGRRFSGGILSAAKEWASSYGLNSVYIQIQYALTGKIKTLLKDFGDVRSSVFGHGEDTSISVVVLAGNDQETIVQTLVSLEAQNFEYRFKVYVLGNYSTDNTLEIAKVFSNVTIISYPNTFDFGERLEKVVTNLDSPVIAFCTAKSILPDDWLSQIYLNFSKKRDKPLDVLTGPFSNSFTKVITAVTSQPFDKLVSKFDFDNFAINIDKVSLLKSKRGKIATVIRLIEQELLDKKLEVHYSLQFKSEYVDKKILRSIDNNTSEGLIKSLKKMIGF